jgi:hypothetical protein
VSRESGLVEATIYEVPRLHQGFSAAVWLLLAVAQQLQRVRVLVRAPLLIRQLFRLLLLAFFCDSFYDAT